MKQNFFGRLLIAGTAVLLSVGMTFSSYAGPASDSAKQKTGFTQKLSAADMALGPGFYLTENVTNPSDPKITVVTVKQSSSRTSVSKSKKTESDHAGEYLGTYSITAYCNCEKCSGGHGLTYAGTVPQAEHTISANLDEFPLGTRLWIDGIVYTVEDKGSSVTENCLDIFFETHEEALAFGRQNLEVYEAGSSDDSSGSKTNHKSGSSSIKAGNTKGPSIYQ